MGKNCNNEKFQHKMKTTNKIRVGREKGEKEKERESSRGAIDKFISTMRQVYDEIFPFYFGRRKNSLNAAQRGWNGMVQKQNQLAKIFFSTKKSRKR